MLNSPDICSKNQDQLMEAFYVLGKFQMLVESFVAPLIVSVAATFFFASSAAAQQSVPISFSQGGTSTTINGTIVGKEYIDYVLNARSGQTMMVSLAITGTNGNGSAFFNILPGGQDYPALFNGSSEGRRAEVRLPSTGNWAIRVYLMGNDADTGKTVGYSIDVSIAPDGASSGSAAPAGTGLLPEEDFFVVNLSNPGGRLNVRNAPSATGSLVGTIANGTNVANRGGCTISDGQQWCNVQAEGGGVSGWVSARFLRLPGPGGGGSSAVPPQQGNVVTIAGVPANDVLNVRAGPGTNHSIVGALGNGSQVRNLRCKQYGSSRWCEIEMITDMRERGWINARFISGQAAQLPSTSRVQRVRFDADTTGTELRDQLAPGASLTYLLGASAGQDLYFRLAAPIQGLSWRLYNPDGSLLDEGMPSKEYRGELWQFGDHKIEVINGGAAQSFNVIFGIE